ncbi:MAG: hypothetical protein BWX99_02956 [Deltaproteobacteria bacterium ADurb.Bin151]|nr:MAG: hypothetical protein BWX99_02956 [Deltaproteobacteria bacterium ADurb.Bin151]
MAEVMFDLYPVFFIHDFIRGRGQIGIELSL